MFLSRKRKSSTSNNGDAFHPHFAQSPNPKTPKTTPAVSDHPRPPADPVSSSSEDHTFVSVLAEAGCTLVNPAGLPCLPSDLHKFRHRLHRRFSDDSALRFRFLQGLSSYINISSSNFRRVLLPSHSENTGSVRSESLMRILLLVESIQVDVQNTLLEKLPEFLDIYTSDAILGSLSLRIEENLPLLILNQFRWLDFLLDCQAFTEKLLQVLSICPLHLKKDIIGSLPEIIGDQNNKLVVDSLRQMLEEDSFIIVPVLDTFSNLNLDDFLQDQVISVALSCIRTVEVVHMPYILRYLLLAATPGNAWKIIAGIREQLKFIGFSSSRATENNKLKGKLNVYNAEASIINALKSSLQFKNILCLEILKELKNLQKIQDHKVIDIWLLVLIYMNCESLHKSVQKLLKKKIVDGCIEEVMFTQCIHGNKDLVQDYLPAFLSISEYLLACKEKRATKFGIHIYGSLFEEFVGTYSRLEIIGALVTHVGSSISHEVSAALETMALLASKYPLELIQLSSHITGILDYLESFSSESLHKVYEVFSLLAVFARSSTEQFGSSIANEFMMIVRKQVSNPDIAYKRMGIIGMLKIISHLGEVNNSNRPTTALKPNHEEALELLKASFDSCNHLPLPLILFHEELVDMIQSRMLHPMIIEWIGKHVGEFESIFLADLTGGELPVRDLYCGLEGELWMNLDGDISPVCLNILPLVSTSLRSASPLQILPAYFLLLTVVERVTNHGSLGGIDALLGCPLHLPCSKYLSKMKWQSLSAKQKQTVVLCLYYAANWIRELLNAFSIQVAERCDSISQGTKQEIIVKLLKRLRNLLFIENMLNEVLKRYPHPLPGLCSNVEPMLSSQYNQIGDLKKRSELTQRNASSSLKNKGNSRKALKASENSDGDGKLKQPTITEMFIKASATTSQEILNGNSSCVASKSFRSEATEKETAESDRLPTVEVSAVMNVVEAQRYKFRPLLFNCFAILAFTKNHDSCCADPAAELPLYLYLLRDLCQKLEYVHPLNKQISPRCVSTSPGFNQLNAAEFLCKMKPLFPSLKHYLDCALPSLGQGTDICHDHWKIQSDLAGNPDKANMIATNVLVYSSVFSVTLGFFSKMINIPDVLDDNSALSDLLVAFQPIEFPKCIFEGMELIPPPGSIGYFYVGAYSFLEGIYNVAVTLSINLASEVVLALESVVMSIQKFLNKSINESAKESQVRFTKEHLHCLSNRLGTVALKLLSQKHDDVIGNGLKIKGEMVQKILHIYLRNNDSTSDALNELACSILPQVAQCRTGVNDSNAFPILCPATYIVSYRVLHEENHSLINNLIKEAARIEKPSAGTKEENADKLLNKLHQSVNVFVSLINICRIHHKVSVHMMAVKYGGKYIDAFLKVFYFLEARFQLHQGLIIAMVKELQKATRTIQTLCSEAKASKQTAITTKIPATKRSLERFLFHVKALLHATPTECTFWMGNLKHKDLMGQVVSSQAYLDRQNETVSLSSETIVQDQPVNAAE